MADADEDYEDEFEAADDDTAAQAPPSSADVPTVEETAPPSPITAVSAPHQAAPSPIASSPDEAPRLRHAFAPRKPVRSVLDTSPWTFTVHAKRIRSLRIPVASSSAASSSAASVTAASFPVIRDLRVFGVVDKQSQQSHGSKWKQEPRASDTAASRSSNASSPARRSRFMEEVYWRNDDGELAWSFTLDRFRRLKAYSPRIKMFVFGIGVNASAESVRALNEDSPKRHNDSIVSLGWFFLDLRTPDLPERWFKLQNSPFGGEILVASSFLPVDYGREQSRPAVGTNATTSRHSVQPAQELSRNHGRQGADCLQFGRRKGSDIFLISVFIRSAAHLHNVVRAAIESRDEERAAMTAGFWLSYSLFDVVVQTDVFYKLDKCEFPPIRDSFRIMSCVEDLTDWLQDQRTLSIYLCTQDRVLASAEMPVTSLAGLSQLRAVGDQTDVEGAYTFSISAEGTVAAAFSISFLDRVKPSQSNPIEAATYDEAAAAPSVVLPTPGHSTITVAYVKLSSSALQLYAEKESIELELVVGEQAIRCPIRFNAFTADYALGDCPDLVLEIDDVSLSPVSVACFSSSTDHSIASSSRSSSISMAQPLVLDLVRDGRLVGQCVLHRVVTGSSPSAVVEQVRSIPGLSHTYRVLIRINALKDFESARPIVISYTNPFTGKERVETSILSVVKKAEVVPPDVYCLFVLHRDESSLKDAMDPPVILDVALALPDGTRDVIGSAVFSLNFLYYSAQSYCCPDPACSAMFSTRDDAVEHGKRDHRGTTAAPHAIKSCSLSVPVMSGVSSASRRVGAMQLEAYIEDTGPISEEQVRRAEEMRVSRIVRVDERRMRVAKLETSPFSPPQRSIASTSAADPAVTRHNVSFDDREDHEQDEDVPVSIEPALLAATTDSSEVEKLKAQLLLERTAWLQDQKRQQRQWKQRVAEAEKARMDELEEEWARREEERSTVLKAAQTEYHKLELSLRSALSEVETRERKLAVAEASLERDQRMLRDDTESLRKRLQTEQTHSVSLANKQVEVLEKRVTELQSHLHMAEQRAVQLEEDFAEYRRQQRKVPEAKLREEIATLRGHVAELERAKQAETHARQQAEANVDKMKTQLEKMAKLVQHEKKQHESRVVDELEQLRLKYIAREERYVLDGDRDELQAIKKQLDDLRRVHVAGSSSSWPLPDRDHGFNDTVQLKPHRRKGRSLTSPSRYSATGRQSPLLRRPSHSAGDEADRELVRLEHEREALLASGAYDNDSFLVRELERRIVLRRDQVSGHQ